MKDIELNAINGGALFMHRTKRASLNRVYVRIYLILKSFFC